ncbi:YqgE/AlgH family protein [Pelistega ratti]|uniref:YqgE/AlgH family protein n=1 Tax=Pelistega ratti TaxID=2652177 RepID=UPI001FAA743A|nr:YqgE/AlgH family protein [Pelistega ratti]
MSDNESLNLEGHFLIAMPSKELDLFDGSVIYVFSHNEDGAVGFIINQPSTIPFHDLVGDITEYGVSEEEAKEKTAPHLVYFGGPVNDDKGFVIHTLDKTYRSTIDKSDLRMTSSKDILIDIAKGEGPVHFMLTLGYAGWDAGQLEEEIADNVWLTVKASTDIIFKCPVSERYYRAIKLLGFDPSLLSGEAGHA